MLERMTNYLKFTSMDIKFKIIIKNKKLMVVSFMVTIIILSSQK